MNIGSYNINYLFKINLEKIIIGIICFYGIYSHIENVFSIDLPVKQVIIFISVLFLVFSAFSSSLADQIKCIIGFSFLGIELVMFLIPLIYLPIIIHYFFIKKKGFKFKKWSVIFITFFCLEIIQLVISNATDFSSYTIFFWFIIFGFSGLFFVYYSEKAYAEEQALIIFSFLKKLIQVQIVVLFVQSLVHHRFFPGDEWNGSFLDADKVSFFLFLLLLYYCAPPFFLRDTSFVKVISIKRLFFFLLIIVLLILCDAKIKNALLLLGLFSFAAFFVFYGTCKPLKMLSFSKTFLFFMVFFLSMGLLLTIANAYLLYISNTKTTLLASVSKYTYAPDSIRAVRGADGKYLMYEKTYYDMYFDEPVTWFLGAGPGKLGSRTSNMLAYDILYKEKGQFKLPSSIPPYSSPLVKKYMKGMWTKEKAQYTRWISANLSFPFAGLITLKAEMGIIGLIIYLLIPFFLAIYLLRKGAELVNPILKNWTLVLSIFWIALPLQMVVDNFQEKPQLMYPMYILTAILLGISGNSSATNSLFVRK